MPSPTHLTVSSAPPSLKADVSSLSAEIPARRYLALLLVALGGFALDLISKELIFHWRGIPRADNVWWIIEPFLGIETALNNGALFGYGQGYTVLFSVLSCIALGGILVWLAYGAIRDPLLAYALAMITGGILGNLYDRLGLWAPPWAPDQKITMVRDFILLRLGSYSWPNFNVADMLLVGGAGLLVWHAYRAESSSEKPDSNDPQADAAQP